MRKAAVLVVDGYEESETVIVDLLRRAGIECHTFGFSEQ